MAEFKARRHRLELPPMPNTDDPAQLKKAMDQMKRLVQDEFNRLSTDFYDFKKTTFEAGIIPLRAPANIAVTYDKYSMSATWENPQQDITPTHVRVRILEVTPNEWALYSYPKSSWEFNGLTPGTQYTFQVQLIGTFESTDTFVSSTRNCPSVAVLRTAESGIKAKTFTTDTGVGPPTDAGLSDPNIYITFPDTDGTPGVAGGVDCYWGYIWQVATLCVWGDTLVSEVEVDGDVGAVTVDTGAAPFSTDPNSVFRLKYREICNGVPQAWVYGEPIVAVDYGEADCLGIVKSASLTVSPNDTADMFALPSVCQADGTWMQIVDALDDTEYQANEPGYLCVEYIDSEWTIIADDTADLAISNTVYTGLLSGVNTTLAAFNAETDFSLAFDIKVPDNTYYTRSGDHEIGADIIDLGGKIKAILVCGPTTYTIVIRVPRDGGGAYEFRAPELAYAVWNAIVYVHDVSEASGRTLYANTEPVGVSANAIANDFDDITGDIQISTVNDMQLRKIYGWSEALVIALDVPGTAGYIMGGGYSSSYLSSVDKILWSTETVSTVTATLTTALSYPSGNQDAGVAGYMWGGNPGRSAAIQKLAFPTEATSTLTAVLASGTAGFCGGMSNTDVAGYVSGGIDNSPAVLSSVQKLTFSSEARSTLGAVLTVARIYGASLHDGALNGYIVAGQGTTAVNKLSYSSETISTLTALSLTARLGQGVSYSGVAGYVMTGSENSVANVTRIMKYLYSTDAKSVIAATCPTGNQIPTGMSDSWSGGGGYIAGGTTNYTTIQKLLYSAETTSTITGTLPPLGSAAAAGVSDGG